MTVLSEFTQKEVSGANLQIIVKNLTKLLIQSRLRERKDWVYIPKKDDIALSLSSVQAIIAIYINETCREFDEIEKA